MKTVTAVRATECGHVLALTRDEQQAKRMSESFDLLLSMGDTRFELTEMDEDTALAAHLDGHSCKKCVINVARAS